jgi:hypothetical protein
VCVAGTCIAVATAAVNALKLLISLVGPLIIRFPPRVPNKQNATALLLTARRDGAEPATIAGRLSVDFSEKSAPLTHPVKRCSLSSNE